MSSGYGRIPWSRRRMNFKRKIDKFDYNKTSSKENIKKGKGQSTNWGKVSIIYATYKGLVSNNII